jgi:urease accessory protein UreE
MPPPAGSATGPLRVSAVLGRITDDDWPETLGICQVDVLRLSPAEAQRTRLRKLTDAGRDVALSLERGVQL